MAESKSTVTWASAWFLSSSPKWPPLAKNGITKSLAAKALEIAEKQGGFTIFALVDALTRLGGQVENAGDRLESDQKAASLLALAV